MKRILAIVLALSLVQAPCHAASSVGPVTMQAGVTSVLELTAKIYQGNVFTGPIVTSMDFGTLTNDGTNNLESTKFFSVYLTTNTSSRKYEVRQTATQLTAGTKTLPAGTTIVTPFDALGTGLPGILGTRGSWVATDKVIYASEVAGSAVGVGAIYAVTSNPTNGATAVIRQDQPGGVYAASVTFTLVLV